MERQDAMHGPTRKNDVWGTRKNQERFFASPPHAQKRRGLRTRFRSELQLNSFEVNSKPPQCGVLVVAVSFAGADGTREAAIEKNKIDGGENHTDDPPGQTDAECPIGSAGVVNRKRERGSPARGKHVRIKAERDARQHAEQVAAGVQESETSFRWRGHSAQVVEDAREAGENDGRKHKSPGMRAEIEENLRLNLQADHSNQQRHHEDGPEGERGDAASAVGNFGFAFIGYPERTVQGESKISGHADQDRVPIENAGVGAEAKVGPQRLEEITLRIEGNAAHDVAERGAKENRQQRAREAEGQVPEGRPYATGDVTAKFDGDAAQDEQPENHHERQIEAAEARGVEDGKREEERAAGGHGPDFFRTQDR